MITPFQYGKKEVIELVGPAIQVTEVKTTTTTTITYYERKKYYVYYHYQLPAA